MQHSTDKAAKLQALREKARASAAKIIKEEGVLNEAAVIAQVEANQFSAPVSVEQFIEKHGLDK